MSDNITAELVAIGTEILLGEITDTNSVYLARMLREHGINVYYMTSVGDNVERIARAISLALGRADIVITCGGLGPTLDDVTRQAVAVATERELVFQDALLEQIEARFRAFRLAMPANNRRQACVPAGAVVIDNPVGTAPAFIVEHEGRLVITLPGVPRELKYLAEQRVFPYLRQRYALGVIRARVLRAGGIGESALDEMLGAELMEARNPTVGLAAHHGVIDVRITAKADSPALADVLLDIWEALVRGRVGQYIFGRDHDTIEHMLAMRLAGAAMQFTSVQAGIGNALLAMEKAAERAGIVQLNQTFDSPAEAAAAWQVAVDAPLREMGEAIAHRLPAQAAGLCIISEPDVDDGADDAIRTVVAIRVGERVISRAYGFGGLSEMARVWSVRWGLANLWRLVGERDQ